MNASFFSLMKIGEKLRFMSKAISSQKISLHIVSDV